MTRDEIITDMDATAVLTINTLLELLAAIPDETSQEIRQEFAKLKGKPFIVVALGLRELYATSLLTPLAREYTKRLIEFVDLARFSDAMTTKI